MIWALRCCVLLAVLGPIAAFAQPAWNDASSDFLKICVAALVAPHDLRAALVERAMAEQAQSLAPLGWTGAVYMATDGARSVTVTRQSYSDLKTANCITSAAASASREDFTNLRRLLEAHPRIGKLEGQLIEGSPTIKIATYKRPGNAPIVTFNFTAAASTTTLSMNRWDLQRGN